MAQKKVGIRELDMITLQGLICMNICLLEQHIDRLQIYSVLTAVEVEEMQSDFTQARNVPKPQDDN